MSSGGILGLDLAGVYGWAVLDNQGAYVASGTGKLRADQDRGAKMHTLSLRLADLVTQYAPDFIACEAPIKRTSFATARNLYGYCAAAHMIAHIREVGFIEFPRAQYTKAVLGNGKASKEDGVIFCRQFKPILNSDDEADAVLVALYAHSIRRKPRAC